MRTGIHPEYVESTVHCSCGNTFVTRSTKPTLHVELCNKCHPFYTGQQKFVDTGGRVQRFSDKFGGAAETVMAKTIAEKQKRQQAHDEAQAAAKAARVAKEAAEAERLAKLPKPKAIVVEEAPAADVVEAASDEAPVEAPAADVVAEEAVAESSPVEEPVVEETPADEPATDETPDEAVAEAAE
ncbi:MAG TPA: 50S ribosomal protein L31 [Coriobacteriia bacterium]